MNISKILAPLIIFYMILNLAITLSVSATPDIIIPDDYSNIQAGIDNAQPYDEILIRPGTYHETIDIDKPLTLYSESIRDVIIDGLGGFIVIDVSAFNVELVNLTVQNGDYGIYLTNTDNAYLDFCCAEYCTYAGIYGYDSYDILIGGGLFSHNGNGIELSYCDRAWIKGVYCSDNTGNGIIVRNSEEVWIKYVASYTNQDNGLYINRGKDCYITDSSFHGNTNAGIDLIDSQDISVCNSECFVNSYGIELLGSKDCYVSKTEMSYNSYGFSPWDSDAVVVNSVIQGNTDSGVYSWDSEVDLRYCDFGDKVEVFNSDINAVDCWWGDPSGPYHPTLNPSGLGVQIDAIVFDPWQITLYQPEVLLSDFKCQKLTRDWMSIYPTSNTEKPLDTSPAMVSDWLSSAFITTKLDTYYEGTDINPDFVDKDYGNNMAFPDECVLSFGGPVVNPVVKYAELDTTPSGDRAPIEYFGEAGINYFRTSDDTPIPDANLPNSVINNDQDMFVIERYQDSQRRVMMLCYGFGWQGTYAAGKYFDTIIAPNIHDFYYEWIIVKWEDTNSDGFVNTPFDGDNYTIVARGDSYYNYSTETP